MKTNMFEIWLDTLPDNDGYLKQIQDQAKDLLKKHGLPKKKLEGWRLTNRENLKELFNVPLNPQGQFIEIKLDSQEISNKLDQKPQNIEQLEPLEIKQILYNKKSLIENSDHDFLKNINEATANNIIGLKIKKGTKSSLEVIIKDSQELLSSSRIILIIEEGASIDITEHLEGEKGSSHSHLIEIFVEKNAKVNHRVIAIGKSLSKLLATISVEQNEKSSYKLTCFQEGWQLSRIEEHIIQIKGNAKSDIKGLQLANNSEQLSTYSFIKFNGPNGSVNQTQKAISSDRAHSIFHGLIDVPEIAQKTEASQLSKNLLLSSTAKIDTSPQLKIIADDVQCSHGATVSQLEQEELFYLQSRGIKCNEAQELLITGFCEEIIKDLPFKIERFSFLDNNL
ncbi:Fe-S cluster assembly protein SufD [Prochlorococcus marinus]|uniref:Fe-S cluster assembly protein SufD n=1 Tax=Prochlorococcus marinus TaxID=1219 RepID=UPI0022B4A8DB|nr:Fe-S cluster assembly protein SufD [Prochlorococcus marinus]